MAPCVFAEGRSEMPSEWDLHASGRREALAAVGDPDRVVAPEVRVEERLEVARCNRRGARPGDDRRGDCAPTPARRASTSSRRGRPRPRRPVRRRARAPRPAIAETLERAMLTATAEGLMRTSDGPVRHTTVSYGSVSAPAPGEAHPATYSWPLASTSVPGELGGAVCSPSTTSLAMAIGIIDRCFRFLPGTVTIRTWVPANASIRSPRTTLERMWE